MEETARTSISKAPAQGWYRGGRANGGCTRGGKLRRDATHRDHGQLIATSGARPR